MLQSVPLEEAPATESFDYDKYFHPLVSNSVSIKPPQPKKDKEEDKELNDLCSQYLLNEAVEEKWETPPATISSSSTTITTNIAKGKEEHHEKAKGKKEIEEEEEDEDNENEYEVEAIVGHTSRRGEMRYVVKWKGYSSRHNTIEPSSNLSNCKGLIEAYKRSLTPRRASSQVATLKIGNHTPKPVRHSPRSEKKNLKEESSSEEESTNKLRSSAPSKEDLKKQALDLIKAKRAAKSTPPLLLPPKKRPQLIPKGEPARPILNQKDKTGPILFPNLTKNATPLSVSKNATPLSVSKSTTLNQSKSATPLNLSKNVTPSKGKSFNSVFPPLNANGAPIMLPKKEIIAARAEESIIPSSSLPIYIQEEEEEVREDVELELDVTNESDKDEYSLNPFEDAQKLQTYLEGMDAFQAKLSVLTGAPITVSNEVDMCPPPADFNFIEKYVGVHFDVLTSTSREGCGCSNGVCISTLCKCNLKRGRKKHRESDLKPLYECNANCPCGPYCPNRRIQREGRTVPLQIFRTARKGWGLRVLRDVKQDEFIDRYVGEVLTPKQADSKQDTTYQFDLDYCYGPDEQGDYVVDARYCGSACRFMNHSCDPNCYVRPMFIWGRNETLPEIGFFAKRDMKAGEELTFDYFGEQRPSGKHPCSCKASNCKGYLFP